MTKRMALGKGLDALIPDAFDLEDGSGRFYHCPVEAIEPNPYQPRLDFSDADLETMAQSIRDKGILTPLLVAKTERGYQLIAGERRWRAAQRAGLERVPVVIREAAGAELLELALLENIHRKDLNVVEEALAYRRMIEELGETQETISKKVGKDRSSVTNIIRILSLPQAMQKDVVEGRLSAGHARVLAGIKNAAAQNRIRDLIVGRGLSVRQAEALARIAASGKSHSKAPDSDVVYFRSLADQMKRSLGTKVEILRKQKGGRVVIHYFSDEELDRLIQRLS
jgi:ParB family chromosome partitioning protein